MDIKGNNTEVASGANQLALQLFQDFPGGIELADKEVGYKKPQTLIQVSSLSLLSRRALNACYFLLADNALAEQEMCVANLAYFKWLIGFESKNAAYLKKALTEAQKSLVQVTVFDSMDPQKDDWISVPLLGKVAMRGGQIAFSVDNSIRRLISNPDQFSYLSLRILAAFSSQYALELYEKLLPYLGAGETATPWMSIEQFDQNWVHLKGKADQREFKYINRDVISPAIAQINEISNLYVELDTRKAPGSRKVSEFRFRVKDNPYGKLVLGADQRVQRKELYLTLTEEFALSDSQLEGLEGVATEKLLSAIEYTRSMVAAGNKIKIPSLYFLKALEGGWRTPKTALSASLFGGKASDPAAENREEALNNSASNVTNQAIRIVEEFLAAASVEGNEIHAVEMWNRFLASPPAQLLHRKKSISVDYRDALAKPGVRLSFAAFLDNQRKVGQTEQ